MKEYQHDKKIADTFFVDKEGAEVMRKLVLAIAGYVLRHSPVFYERKRVMLSNRLHRVFFMDSLEGSLDVMVRGYLASK